MPRLLSLQVGLTILVLCLSAPLQAESPALGFLLRTLGETDQAAGASAARLSSGRELLTDDPANEAIYRRLETQVRGLGLQLANGADLVSYYRFQDAALGQVVESLQRIRELVLGEGSPALSEEDRGMVRSEIAQLYEDIVSSLAGADFNGNKPFAALVGGGSAASWFSGPGYYRLDVIDRLMSLLIRERGIVGAETASLELAASGEGIARENAIGEQSLTDTDIGAELVRLKRDDLRILVDLFLLR